MSPMGIKQSDSENSESVGGTPQAATQEPVTNYHYPSQSNIESGGAINVSADSANRIRKRLVMMA